MRVLSYRTVGLSVIDTLQEGNSLFLRHLTEALLHGLQGYCRITDEFPSGDQCTIIELVEGCVSQLVGCP
jgi:hypothetical protein